MKKLSIQKLFPSSPQQAPIEILQPLPSICHERFDLLNFRTYLNGLERARDSELVIAGCVRDIPLKIFDTNLARCHELGSKFKSYHIVLIENDSKKQFKEYLKQINHPNVTVQSTDFGYSKLGGGRDLRRVTIMSKLRNQYVDIIASRFPKSDYTCVVDLDLRHWRLDGVIHSIGVKDWDMLGANGIQIKKDGSLTYYDTFALIETNGQTYQLQEFKSTPPLNGKLMKVMTCFGGIGLYRTKALLAGKRYSIYSVSDKICSEQCGIHVNMSVAGFDKIYINPGMVVIR